MQGVLTFMSAFNDINGIPASAHPFLLKDLLRGQEFQWFCGKRLGSSEAAGGAGSGGRR